MKKPGVLKKVMSHLTEDQKTFRKEAQEDEKLKKTIKKVKARKK